MSPLNFFLGEHYKELGRRKIFSRKKYFYEFLVICFLFVSVFSFKYAISKEPTEESLMLQEMSILNRPEVLDYICTLRRWDVNSVDYIEQVLEEKGYTITCDMSNIGA
jgi:hypothetical protein